ncbi:PREDICTED: stAR-related lipid transfer protein 5-like [Priapulus caudatus]|uniref:StAR-related lipid transfer protein 5-like n=1 Tax=Priapulus caudatus TaxID=37621 RepID=A0ABM1EP41_PRICU|nr:PREDICTED: stAR-related lipid transfer protein 5-like [Priapulus caudatus]XP_014673961.1 PREDICTED: stAR-related lipid transfer protein 5-like [Priapulus caudatus]XP_014673962.1 PREDICTED: stAR-related lipid transfer protein 5-like [Priapulus caudatus]
MEYRQRAEEVRDHMYKFGTCDDEWKVVKSTKDVVVSWMPSTDLEGHYMYKGESQVMAPAESLFRQVIYPADISFRASWDNGLSSIETLEEIDKDLRVVRSCTKSSVMGLISPRDFVDVVLDTKYDDVLFTAGKSFLYEKCPAVDSHVRGTNGSTGVMCFKIDGDPNVTRVISILNVDLGGMLPKTVVESAMPSSLVSFFSDLKKAAKSLNL